MARRDAVTKPRAAQACRVAVLLQCPGLQARLYKKSWSSPADTDGKSQTVMMFCGAGSFKGVDKEEGAGVGKPAKAKGKKNNPYATRGLDRFSVVLSELESKRERILRRVGSDAGADHLMVRFVQSEAKGWVPIVVKLPHEEDQAADDGAHKRQGKGRTASKPSTPPAEPASPKEEDAARLTHVVAAEKAAVSAAKKRKAGGVRWSWAWERAKTMRPRRYWPLAMALLLLCLVVFGRVFAICCTSIWWYLLPVLTGEEALGLARPPATAAKPRKDVAGIRAADKLALAPPASRGRKRSSSAGAAHEMISPRSHAHRKKG
jgi:hypothetical protein